MMNRRAGVRPDWLKIRVPGNLDQLPVTKLINDLALNTVCQEARCPNIFECWSAGTATFMILGDICTRRCTFCAVGRGTPGAVDTDEPRRVAEAVAAMGVKHAVITMVNRDDLADGDLTAALVHGAIDSLAGCRQRRVRRRRCGRQGAASGDRPAPVGIARRRRRAGDRAVATASAGSRRTAGRPRWRRRRPLR